MFHLFRGRLSANRGQILIVFAGGLVALVVILALVIDGGFVFWIHRQEQDAADPAALAAARYIRYPGPTADTAKMFSAACFYARQNGYFRVATDNTAGPSGCVAGNDDSGTSLTVNYPPGSGAGEYAGRPGFVEVALSRSHRTFFGGIVGLNQIIVTSEAVAAFNLGDSNSNSLVALKASPTCSTLKVTGNGNVTIQPVVAGTNGGYIMVDSNCGASTDATPDACGPGGPGSFDVGGTGVITAPQAYVVGACFQHGGGRFSGAVTEGAPYYADPLASLVGPPQSMGGAYCPTLGRNMVPTDALTGCKFTSPGPFTLNGGVYYGGISVTNRPVLNMNPGIYIMAGGGFNQSGGEVDSSAGDVMIFSTDVQAYYGSSCTSSAPSTSYCQGDIVINGRNSLNLAGLNNDPCPPISSTGCPYAGILFWQDGHASKAFSVTPPQIQINGGSNLQLSGTIYNPAGDTILNGSSTTTGCSGPTENCAAVQIISNTIQINGGAGLTMPYDPSKLYHLDNQGLVH